MLFLNVLGQKIRFTDSTNKWSVYIYNSGPPPSSITREFSFATIDTMINTQLYKRLNALSDCFFREDTNAHKVYLLRYCNNQGHEEVYLDYHLQIGDTVTHIGCDTFLHVVASIDSTEINGLTYRTWYFQKVNNLSISDDYVVAEGIGCIFGPQFIPNPYDGLDEQLLTCFSHNNGVPALQPPVFAYRFNYYFDNVTSCMLKTQNPDLSHSAVRLTSNPADANSFIIFPRKMGNGSLIIFNITGQPVVNRDFHESLQQTIGHLPATGLYIYKLRDKQTGESFTGKFYYD